MLTRALAVAVLLAAIPAGAAELVVGTGKKSEVDACYKDIDRLYSWSVEGTPVCVGLVCDLTLLPEEYRGRAKVIIEDCGATTLADNPSNAELIQAALNVSTGAQGSFRATTSAGWPMCADFSECSATGGTMASATGMVLTGAVWRAENGDACLFRFNGAAWGSVDCSPE
jgi:hypothetical protein